MKLDVLLLSFVAMVSILVVGIASLTGIALHNQRLGMIAVSEVQPEANFFLFGTNKIWAQKDEWIEIPIGVYANQQIEEAVALITFDQKTLYFDRVYFGPHSQKHTVAVDAQQGAIKLTGQLRQSAREAYVWATLLMKVQKPATSTLQFVCNPTVAWTSQLISSDHTDVIDCSQTVSQQLEVVGQSQKNQVFAPCDQAPPPIPISLEAKSGPQAGQITVSWQEPEEGLDTLIAYGEKSEEYVYGVPDVQHSPVIIDHLIPGKTYFVAMQTRNRCAQSNFSPEIIVQAKAGELSAQVASDSAVLEQIDFTNSTLMNELANFGKDIQSASTTVSHSTSDQVRTTLFSISQDSMFWLLFGSLGFFAWAVVIGLWKFRL